jgi:hypothetical protein
MKPRTLSLLVAAPAIGLGLWGAALNSAGANVQQVPNPLADVGRYRMTAYAPGGGLYMNDTATGECWLLNMSAKKWVRAAPPLSEK